MVLNGWHRMFKYLRVLTILGRYQLSIFSVVFPKISGHSLNLVWLCEVVVAV